MHSVEGRLLLSPSDLVGFLACEHLTQRELAVTRGEAVRPVRVDPELELLARKGQEHEAAQLARLSDGRGWVEIADHGETLVGLRAAEAETLEAMRSGVDLIYQATFFDGRWRGRADYLLRVEQPSDLGDWSYEVADAKLARSVKVAALLQMCEYSRQVARLQGQAPESMHVVLGTGDIETHRLADYEFYFRLARARFEAVVDAAAQPTYPVPVNHCGLCKWQEECDARRRRDDHLCLVAGMRSDQTRRLAEVGITTVAALAGSAPEVPVRMHDATFGRLRHQAALQVQERVSSVPVHELVDCVAPGLGLAALPEPSPTDLFFDMEGDPFIEDGGLEYLFGITEVVDGIPRFTPFWGHDRAGEKQAFEALVDLIGERLTHDPSLHVYHYAQYEPVALKKLMCRHGTREDDVDRLLRAGVFVDLYSVVRQGVRVSRESYGLKNLEVFYMPKREEAIAEGVGSIVAYERWRETRDQVILDEIARYNERDCESTWRLRGWLEERRDEWARSRGGPLPRPEPRPPDASAAQAAASDETAQLQAQLIAGVPHDYSAHNPEEAARALLASLLDWHRREEKSEWWAFFERQGKTDEELVDDTECIGNITGVGEVRLDKRSVIHRYGFDPTQEYKLKVGDVVYDPRTGRQCGKIVALDGELGEVDLSRGPSLDASAHPRSLMPPQPRSSKPMKEALRRLAREVIDGGVNGDGAHRGARDLLLSSAPRLQSAASTAPLVTPGEQPVNAAVRLVDSLDRSYLAIQGPPGAGKTVAGARIVVDEVRRGRRVGVCATTHRAIGELLTQIQEEAESQSVDVRILQKCTDDDACPAPAVRHTNDSGDVEKALCDDEVDVVAGTQWLFARDKMQATLDVLVIDEAGQMSLANALAAGLAARNLVLLGDPQQLSQPSHGVHPAGADLSSLQHVLAGHQTIPPERGVFLATTWRMHPDVCAFVSDAFYEGRLTSHAGCATQRISGRGPLAGAGLRLIPVEHSGNRTWSPEEVGVVRDTMAVLLGSTWTDRQAKEGPLGIDEILVVAPYNVQVRQLREALPVGARVGTVDKFQGQQAAVVIYAMATSAAEDVPRNLEFLFNRNRLNVAVSRARAMAVIVCSPQLLRAGCRTPDQLRLVSALCRFAEMATTVGGLPPPAPPAASAGQVALALEPVV